MKESKDVAVVPDRTLAEVIEMSDRVHAAMKEAMKPGVHYGTTPGTNKPALLKSGAEKLNSLFRFIPRYTVERHDLEVKGSDLPHFRYNVTTMLFRQGSDEFIGEGVGSATTLEKKYRYRSEVVFLDDPIPEDYRDHKDEYRKKGFGCRKDDEGNWRWCSFEAGENKDLGDLDNTILKMAKKRSLVDATTSALAASDCFTQDLSDEGATLPAEVGIDAEFIDRLAEHHGKVVDWTLNNLQALTKERIYWLLGAWSGCLKKWIEKQIDPAECVSAILKRVQEDAAHGRQG